MNIVGFGDSFIHPISKHDITGIGYMNLVGEHFNVTAESRGVPGSGPWNAFFDFLKYEKPIDVAIIAWSESARLYHKNCTINVPLAETINDGPNADVYNAAKFFYRFLFDKKKQDYEQTALMCMFDQVITKKFPDTKFIHMHCFPEDNYNWPNRIFKLEDEKYAYEFENSVEIRPSLLYLSQQDGWSKNLADEKRNNHLSNKFHLMLSKAIIYAIENYRKQLKVDVYDFA